ncbi:efflux RND transporter periplasmic adaptor subunit [Comamonas sp. JUb58]|uniref:efflux RND transporter periplasmic adaptor subunit n=1 Tax=Comamonas sp. JUb58 TaxID=2485114 RepID=UPI001060C671|nr:efflux RND transporter periplasmic adaptor subunit [Comamonas sp. JUb58]TDS83226.1 cobalt-zinc-cadmium efflux system membrane fusion protein [Comamonas sp. JUb58]
MQSLFNSNTGRALVWATTAASLVLALSGCSGRSDAAAPEAQADRAKAAALAPGQVRLQPASLKMLDIVSLSQSGAAQTVAMPARVAFQDDKVAAVAIPVEGRVVSVNVQVGDKVQAGATLATLVSPEALRIRYEVEAARTAKELAAVEEQRQRTMLAKGVGVEMELRAAQSKLRETAQELARAQGVAALLGSGSGDKIVLRAPRAGVIAERNALPGAAAESGAALFLVGDPGAMRIVADAFEGDLAGIHLGADAVVKVQQLAVATQGTVRNIGAVLDKESRRATVLIDLKMQPAGLRPGMQASVEIPLAATQQMLIPVTAVLIKDGDRSLVFVQAEDAVFEARTVVLGQPLRGMVPVQSGLQAGDRIVVRGGLLLDGAASQML